MPERRKIHLGDREVDVVEVEIVDRKREAVAEYRLEDGSVIRVANPTMQVFRMEGAYDPQGRPVYLAVPGTAVSVIFSPDELVKKA